MENENKDKIILTDEELKNVTGGSHLVLNLCNKKRDPKDCVKTTECTWKNGKCVLKG